MRFSEGVTETYPYPLAAAAKRINDAIEHLEEYLCLANLLEIGLKYLAAIGLSQYLHGAAKDDQVHGQLEKLTHPTLGVWNEILRVCMRFYAYSRAEPFVVSELRDGYATEQQHQEPGQDPTIIPSRS